MRYIAIIPLLLSLCFAQECEVKCVSVPVTKAQLQTIATTPVVLIPSPGQGATICILHAILEVKPGTKQYIGLTELYLKYDIFGLAVWEEKALIQQNSNLMARFTGRELSGSGKHVVPGAPVVLMGNQNPIQGNSEAVIHLIFVIQKTP